MFDLEPEKDSWFQQQTYFAELTKDCFVNISHISAVTKVLSNNVMKPAVIMNNGLTYVTDYESVKALMDYLMEPCTP